MPPDLESVAAIIREIAEAEILPRFQKLGSQDIHEKSGPLDLVTIADTETEKALSKRLLAAYPGTLVLGEEAAAADPGILGILSGETPVWVLDPVDGTLNFAQGRPDFAVIVAYVEHGRTIAGWIHSPLTGTTIQATRGQGAWSAGERLQVAMEQSLSVMTGSAYGSGSDGVYLSETLEASGRIGRIDNRMCGAVEYIGLVRRQRHFLLSRNSLPWDHAAGILIAEEAGAHAAFLDGSPYDPKIIDGRILVAPGPAAWTALQAEIRPLIGV